ncbi:hypothetical protein Q427_01625 [Halomonas sp. BC04]|nr:hypothetical protein Q427_01625 [Halomonas sp. BC04]
MVAVALLAVIWAIFAHNSAGNHRDRSAALEEQLAAIQDERQQLASQLQERDAAGEDIEALEARVAELNEEQQAAEAALAEEQEAARARSHALRPKWLRSRGSWVSFRRSVPLLRPTSKPTRPRRPRQKRRWSNCVASMRRWTRLAVMPKPLVRKPKRHTRSRGGTPGSRGVASDCRR